LNAAIQDKPSEFHKMQSCFDIFNPFESRVGQLQDEVERETETDCREFPRDPPTESQQFRQDFRGCPFLGSFFWTSKRMNNPCLVQARKDQSSKQSVEKML